MICSSKYECNRMKGMRVESIGELQQVVDCGKKSEYHAPLIARANASVAAGVRPETRVLKCLAMTAF